MKLESMLITTLLSLRSCRMTWALSKIQFRFLMSKRWLMILSQISLSLTRLLMCFLCASSRLSSTKIWVLIAARPKFCITWSNMCNRELNTYLMMTVKISLWKTTLRNITSHHMLLTSNMLTTCSNTKSTWCWVKRQRIQANVLTGKWTI